MMVSSRGKASAALPLGKERRMRRFILLLAAMSAALVMASGVALALTKVGGPGGDTLRGTKGSDTLIGKGGRDMMIDGPVRGDSAADTLGGGKGNDNLLTFNRPAARDIVGCGAGRDSADVDRKDVVGDDCERVSVH
jgi:hypothetical protein